MDFGISGINFQGKKEILYGLKKAAEISRSTEQVSKSLIQSRIGMQKSETIYAYNASLRAYIDMIIRDSAFLDTINNRLASHEIRLLRTLFEKQSTQHGMVEPLELFKNTALDVAQKNKSHHNIKEGINKLCNMIA